MKRLILPALLALLCAALFSPAPVTLTRGPFLQLPTPTSMTIVVRVDAGVPTLTCDGREWIPVTPPADSGARVFVVDGLEPGTSYTYDVLGVQSTFTTPPLDDRPFRFLAFGDSGTGSSTQLDVATRMEAIPGVSLILGLGDLVYESGAESDFDPKLFNPYRLMMRRAPFWPTLGNHDADTSNGAPFYKAFFLPTETGAPGNVSGTERYYSFDHGNAHFVCLDSESSSSSPTGAMATWLVDDLEANQLADWRIVFMHHPIYSRGSHNSDSESELRTLRNNLRPIFDAWNVDLVLVGHSHNYERSFLVREDAPVDETSPFEKPPPGAVYVVSGCAGKTSTSGDLDHPLMAPIGPGGARGLEGSDNAGFSYFDVFPEAIVGRFVDRHGAVRDTFEIRRGQQGPRPPKIAQTKPPGRTGTVVIDNSVPWDPNPDQDPEPGWAWISPEEIDALAASGPAWNALVEDADELGPISVGDQNDADARRALAGALVWSRVGGEDRRAEVQARLLAAIGTESSAPDALGLSRNAGALAMAAPLIDWVPPEAEVPFRTWMQNLRAYVADGRSIISTHEDRPNNWGTWAGASRLAIAVYLGDQDEIDRCAQVFRGWLGDRSAYSGFDYGELCWQANPSAPVGINPEGATLAGVSVDGVLPDDQRRALGDTACPPDITCENYAWEALAGVVVQAEMLRRLGYDPWHWEDQALRRAFDWLHDVADCAASGNDTWIPHVVNRIYGTHYPAPVPSQPGRLLGWGDWTHAP
jgi:3',5'-cyclic AMP phosphodiesterase CpdA